MTSAENSLVVARSFAAGMFGSTEEIRASEWFSVLLDCALEQGLEAAQALCREFRTNCYAYMRDGWLHVQSMFVSKGTPSPRTMICLGEAIRFRVAGEWVPGRDISGPTSPCDPRWGRPGTPVFRARLARHLAETVLPLFYGGPCTTSTLPGIAHAMSVEINKLDFMTDLECDCRGGISRIEAIADFISFDVCRCVEPHRWDMVTPTQSWDFQNVYLGEYVPADEDA